MATRTLFASSLAALCSCSPFAAAQPGTIGPDMISSSHSDVARNGVSGSTVGYSIGSITCSRGDMPMAASPDANTRPIMSQGMYRLKTFTAAGGATYQRLEQIGQGWCKWVGIPINGSSPTCGDGSCDGGSAGHMGVNCADLYSSGFNGPAGMARRSFVNATTGVLSGTRGGGTDPSSNTNTRLQVAQSDVSGQPAGTRFFVETTHVLPHDAQYVRAGQTIAINAMNNCSSQEINIAGGTGTPTLIGGAANRQISVIERWKELDPSVTMIFADHDDTPNPNNPNKFIKCRFIVAGKVIDIGGGLYHYEYAIFNHNSDRSGGSFTIPLPAGASFTEYSFRHPLYHSGENISNTPWTATRNGDTVTFATVPFATAANANAIRWETMYNFSFNSNAAPVNGEGTLGLFKPAPIGGVSSIALIDLPVPEVPTCIGDFNGDGLRFPDDLSEFITCFFLEVQFPGFCPRADFNGDSFFLPDDLSEFITAFFLSDC